MSKYTQPFVFQHFQLFQDKAAMKVGTDGVLLGAWADVPATGNVLDVGTGTGLIALMIAQRSESAITAIDADPLAAEQAKENFQASPWKERLIALSVPLQAYRPEQLIDLIISNPPFFTESLKSGDAQRDRARHTDSLSPAELFAFASEYLSEKGRLCLIFPFHHREDLLQAAWKQGLVCTKEVNVIPKEGKNPERILFEFARDRTGACLKEEITLFESDGRTPTAQWRLLAAEYYPHF